MNKKTIELIKQKDEEAFEKLYAEYEKLVRYVIYQIVKDNYATDSLLQDTFIAVYEKISQYRGGSFKYWLLQIAKNKALNYATREQLKEKRIVNDYDMVKNLPDTHVAGLGMYEDILSESFSQEEKDIIVYRIVFGYKFKEIAEIMEKTPKYVSAKYKQTLGILKQIMEG